MADFYEIKKTDVGAFAIVFRDKSWVIANFMGRVLLQDVGKRIFERGGILQVENDKQLAARLKKRKDW